MSVVAGVRTQSIRDSDMKKIALISWSDSNIGGDYWRWFVTLTIRNDGKYSVGAFQTCVGAPTYRLPSIYPLKRGRQVKEAIEQLFLDDNLQNEDIDWDSIISVASQHVPKLGAEIKEALEEGLLAETRESKVCTERTFEKSVAEGWVRRATWPRSNLSHHIANGMDNHQRWKIVHDFVVEYLSANKVLPTGVHDIRKGFTVVFPKSKD